MAAEHFLSATEGKIASDISQFINFIYELIQSIVIWIFSPPSHTLAAKHNNGLRIAVIGAGLSGVSAAAHCAGHGADLTIFEARSEKYLGSIWARVNSTSSLQLYSVVYRFHPTVRWHKRYPSQGRILEEIRKLWYRYGLNQRTSFETPVHSVTLKDGRWVINGDSETFGTFDGIIAAVGTCGDPKLPHLPGEEAYKGRICHSSDLDCVDIEGKRAAIIGGGASAIEAVEFAIAKGAEQVDIVSRVSAPSNGMSSVLDAGSGPCHAMLSTYSTKQSEKWIIPRNIVVDILLSMNVFGEEAMFSFVPEFCLRWFFYRDLKDLAPQGKGFYTGTPMCNDQILEQIRTGRCRWLIADIIKATKTGLLINHRAPNVRKGGPGTKMEVDAQVLIKATGFSRPDIHFLPEDVFEKPFASPAWYLQTFPPRHPEICAINSIYVNALGTVGHIHTGIYTRLLMVFLLEPRTKPSQAQMDRWVSWICWFNRKTPQRAFDYFTYSELMLWFVSCVLLRPSLWQWAWFVFTGLGQAGPSGVSSKATLELKADELNGLVAGEKV